VAVWLAVALLLGQMGLQLMAAARADTATYDEPVNVRSGVVYALDHDLSPNPEHPPLTKLLSGWSVTVLHPAARRELAAAFAVVFFPQAPEYGNRVQAKTALAQQMARRARVPMVVLTLFLGVVVFAFARDLFGPAAALISLAAYSLAPELIGHGHLATNDLPAAGFFVTSLWCALRVRGAPVPGRWPWVVAAGLALGAGLATKYQVLVYAPVTLALVAGAVWRSPSGAVGVDGSEPADGGHARSWLRWRSPLAAAAAAGALAVAVVWVVTLLVEPGATLHFGPTGFGDHEHGLVATVVDHLPLPASYRAGLRYQLAYSQVPKQAFLLGQSYSGHRFWYPPVVLTIKYPVITLGLWLAGLVVVVLRRHRAALVFAVAPALYVLAVDMWKGADIGDRYVIATPVLLMVMAGAPWTRGGWRWVAVAPRRWMAGGVTVALLGFASVTAVPHQIAYANELWGGTRRAYLRVSDSAVDWGQDLDRLAVWVRRHAGGRPVYLQYFGTTQPAAVGLRAIPFGFDRTGGLVPVPQGVVAVSVTWYNQDRGAYVDLGPVRHTIGGSILIFEPPPGAPGVGSGVTPPPG